jgi:hypothetical protein
MSVFLDLREMPETPEKTETPNRIFIGTDLMLGKGSSKTAYSCKITDANKSLFVLPQGTDESKLCIVVIDINMILLDKYSKNEDFMTLFYEYIDQSTKEKWYNENKKYFESKIDNEIRSIEQEIELQKELFEKQLAPRIYHYYIHRTSNIYYILEEKCGTSLVNHIRIYSDKSDIVQKNKNGKYKGTDIMVLENTYTNNRIFDKIVELTHRIANAGYINTDLKPENTCTQIEQTNASLANIIALDADTHFFIRINLSTKGLVENAQIFMLTLIISYLGKWCNIKFTKDVIGEHLTREKIKNMITFFVYNKLICNIDKHPLYMLYHYIIGLTSESSTICVDNQTLGDISYITDEICQYIFFDVKRGGRGKTKRNKRTKRTKK